MPYYKPLENCAHEERTHIIDNLLKLREKLAKELPGRTARSTLLLSTWNIRELSCEENRCPETYWYMAEIISFFDLVAVQEIGNDMSALKRIMDILGYKFSYIVTDTPNIQGGNERMAYIFNTGKVSFKNVAGEIILTKEECIEYNLPEGFARPPFVVAFQASWFKFYLCNVHIYYGSSAKNEQGVADSDRRRREIAALAKKLGKRALAEDISYVLIGDFNIEKIGDKYYNALVGKDQPTGFYIHPKKSDLFTNKAQKMQFDQIAFNIQNITQQFLGIEEKTSVKMGVVNFYDTIFCNEEYYRPIAASLYEKRGKTMPPKWKFENWKTFQMSDHLPLWVELQIDFTDEYLEKLKTRPSEESQSLLVNSR